MARALVAKAVYDMPTTRVLLDRLDTDVVLRRICGEERKSEVPSESVFSRAFAEFSDTQLPQRVHEALILGSGRDVRARIGHEPVPVRHLDARQRGSVDPVVLADEIVEEEHVGDCPVDLDRGQQAGLVERHRAVHVVPQRGGRRPVAAHAPSVASEPRPPASRSSGPSVPVGP